MKLFHSPASPYVRKVVATAHETGHADAIELVPAAAGPVKRDEAVVAANPLGKVPTLVCQDGLVLYDSRVICEYLDANSTGAKVFPAGGRDRWEALARQALGDGLMDAALLARYEDALRPAERRWPEWREGQMAKVASALRVLEADAGRLGQAATIGTITIGCALGYLDFRFADLNWRAAHPATAEWFAAFDERPAMAATRAKG